MDKLKALGEYFGHNAFRQGQEELIDALLCGRDALGVMPTGSGKSMCYQLPALLLPGVSLVISPLISLMKDQVAALSSAGVPVAFINSSLTLVQHREVLRRAEAGMYKLIYVAPERLDTADFLSFAQNTPISMVAVDEAHCVSQWGQDFRPSYLHIAEFVERLPRRPAVGAFTATATTEVKEDVIRLLRLKEPLSLTTGFDRENLYFEVLKPKSKSACLWELLRQREGKSGIIYCATRKAVESVCGELRKKGVLATQYHAGLANKERRGNQEDFDYDRARVMVATNAFGMGIDKSNVSFVIHYNMPKNLESYYQEAGRAGRDGEKADCVLLFSNGDIQTSKFLIRNTNDNQSLTYEEREALLKRDLERLEVMIGYCKTNGCLRAYILNYFGQRHGGNCGNCGSCRGEYRNEDITITAQKIFSSVVRVEKDRSYGLGVTLYVRLLCGSRDKRVLELELDKLTTYGTMKNVSRPKIREYIDYLVSQGYMYIDEGEFPVLRLEQKAADVLFRGQTVAMPVRAQPAAAQLEEPRQKAKSAAAPSVEGGGLLAVLKEVRAKLAQEAGMPSYIVFSNATLSDMATKMPRTTAELLQISGVGAVKAQRYGAAFLKAIGGYLGE